MPRFTDGFRNTLIRLVKSEDGEVSATYPIVPVTVLILAVIVFVRVGGPWIVAAWVTIKASF